MSSGRPDTRPDNRRLLERLPIAVDRPAISYGAALGTIVLATLLRFLIGLPDGFPFVTFVPAVVAVAFVFGWRAGVLAAFASSLAAAYFFIRPLYSFRLDPASWFSIAVFLLSTVLLIGLIHWMQKTNARLEEQRRLSAALAENRELLFRELQHRVSNNLQVVAAVLALQKRHIADDQARAAIDEASRRLGLIGRIHRQLYEPTGERIGMAPFLSQLASDVIDSAGMPGAHLQLDLCEALDLRNGAVVPVALIVSEAISNAVEHGLAERETGTIRVGMERTQDGGVILEVGDDGPGLAPGFDPEHSTSLGLRIASTLARQLGGRFEMVSSGGALARLILPQSAVADRPGA